MRPCMEMLKVSPEVSIIIVPGTGYRTTAARSPRVDTVATTSGVQITLHRAFTPPPQGRRRTEHKKLRRPVLSDPTCSPRSDRPTKLIVDTHASAAMFQSTSTTSAVASYNAAPSTKPVRTSGSGSQTTIKTHAASVAAVFF